MKMKPAPLPPLPEPPPQNLSKAQHPSLPAKGNEGVLQRLQAPVQEVFSSFQGEGPYIGHRQVFVRFAHCHLKCLYCDTPMQRVDGLCALDLPGVTTPTHTLLPNPISLDTLTDSLAAFLRYVPHHSVSFTGGEPLLYHRFLAALMPLVQPWAKTYLETSGTQPEFLAHVLPWTDIVAMDVKLPSATGEAPMWQAHTEFLQLALGHKPTDVFLKLVFNNAITPQELEAVAALAQWGQAVPVMLQPQTHLDGPLRVAASNDTITMVYNALAPHFANVRVIPQAHKLLNVR
jgi:7-carboxy-7-deazaguanine synthase